MKKIIGLFLAILPVVAACTRESMPQEDSTRFSGSAPVFTAIFGDDNADTKIYLDSQARLRWNSFGDSISVFSPGIHSLYAVEHLENNTLSSVKFYKVEDRDVASASYYGRYVGVYPYSDSNVIDSDGKTLHMYLPEWQNCYNYTGSGRTFTYNEYPMVAVTEDLDDYILRFRATCGVLVVPISGTGVLGKVVLKGNDGEVICGPAKVDISNPSEPVMTMEANEGKQIENYSLTGIELGQANSYQIAFILPPMTFKNGFTLEVYDIAGNVTTIKTERSRTISRSVINTMDDVVVNGAYTVPFTSLEQMTERFNTILDYMGWSGRLYEYPDDWGILSTLYCNDVEGADLWIPDSGYNWFYLCGELIRDAGYRNTSIRFKVPFEIIKSILDFNTSSVDITGQEADSMRAQLRVLRAYLYSVMAPEYQFGLNVDPEAPCVPILDSYYNYENLSRASVKDVYNFILDDLSAAINQLDNGRASKKYIDKSVALGLRARVSLAMGNYQQAYADAVMAAQDYTPASIEEVSVPSFMDISEHNWIWGVDMTPELSFHYRYATTSSWLRSFSANAYATAVEVYACVNNLLYDRIPSTDVRKGWWVNDCLESPLIENITWTDGSPVAWAQDSNKVPFIPYTNVKFGCNPVGTTDNAEDMPLMRVEEMLLIQAEAKAWMGDETAARSILDAFVSTYRDPEYRSSNSPLTLLDEIWFQRRVELWGEGFFMPDLNRLGKPLVRYHEGEWHAIPDWYSFNLPAGYGGFLLMIPNYYIENYPNMVQNTQYGIPHYLTNGDLRDGVTD